MQWHYCGFLKSIDDKLCCVSFSPYRGSKRTRLHICLISDEKLLRLRLRFFGRIQKRICELRSYEFFTAKENGSSQSGKFRRRSFTMTTASPRALRDEKNRGKKQQTDPRGEEKKEKQHKLRMNIQNLYISVWSTNVSRIEYTLG